MASRPRAGRGAAGRDSSKDVDVTADLLARVLEGLRKAQDYRDTCDRLGQEIITLEQEAKVSAGGTSVEQVNRLDGLYREVLRNTDLEKAVHIEYELQDNIAILQSLNTPDEPVPARNGTTTKSGSRSKPGARSGTNDPEVSTTSAVDSPAPSPTETRSDLKRVKGTTQRSSSVASAARSAIGGAGTKVEVEMPETNRGVLAEKAGTLVVGTEVFLRQPNAAEGIGIQCIIKKIWHEKKPISYDVQDPEPDSNGKVNIHKCTAKELIPIPPAGSVLPTFSNGANVFARYPETDTFYKAKVRGFHKGLYTLKFEGEEDDKEMDVDKRFVLDSKLR